MNLLYSSDKYYITSKPPYGYRPGELARVVGVTMVKPPNRHWRLCLVLEYEDDGKKDYVPIGDIETHYQILWPADMGEICNPDSGKGAAKPNFS